MMEQHKSRRNQFQNEEIFEPIEIDFGYEDAVAFDSDKEPINFDKYEDKQDDSSKVAADDHCGAIVDTDEKVDDRLDTLNSNSRRPDENGSPRKMSHSPCYSPRRRNSNPRNSISLSHRSSPLLGVRHPPRVNEQAGMGISDDEHDPSSSGARIYDCPLNSGQENRLAEDETRMVISESDSQEEHSEENQDLDENNETPVLTGHTTPGVVSSIVSSEALQADLLQAGEGLRRPEEVSEDLPAQEDDRDDYEDSDWPKHNSGNEPITVSSQDSSQEGVYELRYGAEDDHEDNPDDREEPEVISDSDSEEEHEDYPIDRFIPIQDDSG